MVTVFESTYHIQLLKGVQQIILNIWRIPIEILQIWKKNCQTIKMTQRLDMQIWSKMENATCVLTLIKLFTVHSVHTKVISMTYQKLWMMIFVWCITVWLWTKANFANFRIRHHLIFSNLCQVTFHSKLSYPFILLCIFSLCPLTNFENLLLECSSETLR